MKEGVAAAVMQLVNRPDICRPVEVGPTTADEPTGRDRMQRACSQAAAWMRETSTKVVHLVRRAWDGATANRQWKRVRTAVGPAKRLLAAAACWCWSGQRTAMRHWPTASLVAAGMVAALFAYSVGLASAGVVCGGLSFLLIFAAAGDLLRSGRWAGWRREQAEQDACPLIADGGRC